MFRRPHTTGTTLAAAIGLAMLAPAALAQTQAAPAPPPASAPAARPAAGPTPSDAELKNFAHAAVEVEGIRQSLQPKLAAASPADQTKLKASAEKQMESAVKRNNLTLQRYVQIANVVQTDDAVRSKVQGFMPPQPAKS